MKARSLIRPTALPLVLVLLGGGGPGYAKTINLTQTQTSYGQNINLLFNTVPDEVPLPGGTNPGDTVNLAQTATGGIATSVQIFSDPNSASDTVASIANGDGAATAIADVTSNGLQNIGAYALGGAGASGSLGGTAIAIASGVTTGDNSTYVTAGATAGQTGDNDTHSGFGPVGFSPAAQAYGQSDNGIVSVTAVVSGALGSEANAANNASAGGNAKIVNAVSGSTGGALSLIQTAEGGNGGGLYCYFSCSHAQGQAGPGGNADSELTYTDGTASSLTAYTGAFGGSGGDNPDYSVTNATPGNGGNAYAFTHLVSTRSGAPVTASAYANGGSAGQGIVSSLSGTPIGGAATAVAYSQSINAWAISGALASGDSSDTAQATSKTSDGSNHWVETTVNAPLGPAFGEASVHTATNSGGAGVPSLWANGNDNWAFGGASSEGVLHPNNGGLTEAKIGDAKANFSIAGAGEFSASSSEFAVGSASFEMSAEYNFSVASGDDLLLGLLDNNTLGKGFDSATLVVSLNGRQLIDQTYNSVAALEARLADPFDFGAKSGSDDLDISFDETVSTSNGYSPYFSTPNGFSMQYVVAAAATGSITGSVSAVPLPGALPMFAAGLAVLGFAANRRKRDGSDRGVA